MLEKVKVEGVLPKRMKNAIVEDSLKEGITRIEEN